jgi:YVTN family beta-propeller protein
MSAGDRSVLSSLVVAFALCAAFAADAGQVPGRAGAPDVPVSHRDRFYTADQFSNTVSVIDPAANRLLGVIRLGDPSPGNMSPLYRGQVLVHGLGFSPDHRTLAAVSIGSNSVTFIDTSTNAVKHVTYVGRAPHEAFFTPDGKEVWVTVRGEDYIDVLDAKTYEERSRIKVPNGPGMTTFSPDGRFGYVCSSFTPETVVIATKERKIVGHVTQDSPFCPNIAASPDGTQVWLTLKDKGEVMAFSAQPPFDVIKVIETGPITNHVNFVSDRRGQRAYVTVGGLGLLKVFRTDTFRQIATISLGSLPHGLWPSGDGSRLYVGLENGDAVAVVDTATDTVVATIPVGQGPQAVAYVSEASPNADGLGLQSLDVALSKTELVLLGTNGAPATHVTLFDQGLVQILQASVTGLPPRQPFFLALAGAGTPEPLASFMTNPAGAAIVDTVGPIRQIIRGDGQTSRRTLVVMSGTPARPGERVQHQAP